ncbi:MAG TPA: hypothetical protein DDW27_13240 [Bacteroidales bacterium]|nr:hypothetical protein [Bacteroidales bacterium]
MKNLTRNDYISILKYSGMIGYIRKHLSFFIILLFLNPSGAFAQRTEKLQNRAAERLKKWENPLNQWKHIAVPKPDSVKIETGSGLVNIFFPPQLSYYPFREESCREFISSLKESLGRKFRNYNIQIFTNNYGLDQLVPNYFRVESPVDSSRFPRLVEDRKILIRKEDRIYPEKGLSGNSIALWHSHGYYFEMNLDRWEYQRAKLFGTVEDISIMGYVVPYLTRMLENAGATVFLPRERDIQKNEVIVDNDWSTGSSELFLMPDPEIERIREGFLLTDTLFPGHNPFRQGTSLRIKRDSAVYIPEIPEKGYYAVYVSYPLMSDNCRSVKYIVNHTGGSTDFIADQTIGGETWIYLGTFLFDKGKDITRGSVTVRAGGKSTGYIALDAVKFGGGMGNVARKPSAEIINNQQSAIVKVSGSVVQDPVQQTEFGWKISGKPRFLEGARYYLQYAGMPDTMVYSPNTYKNDYNDDYMSRSLWVNYLIGEPFSAYDDSRQRGLGIPIDLSLAFHTDAGVTPGDSVIGTLAIYSTATDNARFPDGTSRMASRDLSDIIQTQIVEDIRELYNPGWTRRGIWDRPYYEARRPNIPGMLLELLSHQNLADQKYGLDPRFRFDVGRAVYKGILKYLAYVENREYVVQPLPVTDFAIMPVGGKKVRLSWEPVTGKLEPSSAPDRYIVYKRTGENGFDNGTLTYETFYETELESFDTIYGFKVTAVNNGGESFDSEILSAGIRSGNSKSVLIVNGFDRISGPSWYDSGNMAGITWWDDRGVADHYDFIHIGDQYDFTRKNPWLDDDSPGWGASYSDMAGKVIAGNSFDYPYIHGKAVMNAGYSFYSVSDEFFCSDDYDPVLFNIVDLIFGEEKSTPFFNDTSRIDFRIYTSEFMKRIEELTKSGTSIFMSGAYIGSDLKNRPDSTAIKFAGNHLHFIPRTGHAVKKGEVYATDYAKPTFSGNYSFNTDYSENIYSVEAPDAIEPSGAGATCAFRYKETNSSAGVMFNGKYRTVILGFPFETIVDEGERNSLMKQVLNFFNK